MVKTLGARNFARVLASQVRRKQMTYGQAVSILSRDPRGPKAFPFFRAEVTRG